MPENNFNYSPPELNIREKDMTAEWYMNCVRYFSLAYNRRTNILDANELEYPLNAEIEAYKYYLGIQDNVNYNHVTLDETGNTLPGVFIKGQKIAQLIDYMNGVFQKSIRNIHIDAEAMSKDAYDEKTLKKSMALMEYDMKPLLEAMANEGIAYGGMGGNDMEAKEDVYRFFETDFKEQGELDAIDTSNDILFRNRFMESYPKGAMTCFITGKVAMHNYVQNGKVWQELIPTYNLIWDNSVDDDYNRHGQFIGIKRRMPLTDAIQKYHNELSKIPGAIAELKRIAVTGVNMDFIDTYNINPNFSWWIPSGIGGVPEVTVVTMYWISSKDLRYEETKDPYGKTYISNVKKANKSGEFYTSTVRKATLLGNKFLVDWGENTNIVRDFYNPSDTRLPIQMFVPNMYLGRNKSIVGRLAQNQDKLDRLSYQIDQKIGRDLGKTYIVNGHKLGDGVSPQNLLQDLKTMGLHVTQGVSGEDDDRADGQRMVEVVDMTLDPNVQLYVTLKREEERIMEEIVNISKVALGQQTSYIGYGTQQNTIAQSALGQSYLYDGLMQFFVENLQYAADMQKIVWDLPEFKDEAIAIVGKRGAKWLELTQNDSFERYLIKIKVSDQMDEATKQRLTTMAQALAQNGLIDFLDVLRIESATSLVQLRDEIEYSVKKKQRQNEQQQQQQMAMQQMMQQQDARNKAVNTVIQQEGGLQKEKQKGKNAIISKMADAQMQQADMQMAEEAAAQEAPPTE